MATITKLVDTIDSAIDKFNSEIPSFENRINKEVRILVKDLETKGDNIVQSVNNLRTLNKINKALEDIFKDPKYISQVKDFATSFSEISALNNQYFNEIAIHKPSEFLAELRKQSVADAVNSLTGSGVSANVTSKLSDLIFNSIKSGSSYSNLLESLRKNVLTDKNNLSGLARYAKQITTDSLNQYNAAYQDNVTADLGLEWFMYVGALIDTSRDLCKACVKKKYIHKSEIPDIVKGNFKEFKDIGGGISAKTDLPYGMIEGTDASNFIIRRGGYSCGHKLVPVSKIVVPKELVAKFDGKPL